MRSFKKLLALLLAVTMIASVLAVPAFATGDAATEAEVTSEATEDEAVELSNGEKLELLGLLIGDGNGVTDAYLAQGSTRMQLAILNARWLGFEEDSYAFEDWDDDVNFVDYDDGTSEAEWNMLAYYYADEELGFIGIGYDVFDPQAVITNKQLAKILLVAMGYPYGEDYDWDDILGFASDAGVELGSAEVEITNTEVADALVAALESTSAFGTEEEPMTFAQYLLEMGIVTEDALIEAGIAYEYVDPTTDPGTEGELPTLEVTSAAANNFSEVELTFNQAVDAASVENVVVKIDSNSVSSGAKTYVVADYGEGAVVRIYEPLGFVGAQNEYRTINVTGLKTAGGIAMTAFSQQITFRDSAAPAIEKVVAKGNTRLDVYFSEPIMTSDAVKLLSNYQVGGKTLSASNPTINDQEDTNTSRIATLKNIKTTMAAGTYVLGILGTSFKDFAGNTLGYQTSEFEIIADSEGPIAQSVLDPVFQYKVQIEFNEEITEDAQIRWVDGTRNNTSSSTTVEGNVATFEFSDNSGSKVIPIGGTTITLINAKDYSNNVAQQPLSFDVVPVGDTVRPEVVGYGADKEGTIWVKFNKKINFTSIGSTPSKWVIKNADGDTTYDWTATYDAEKDDKRVELKGGADAQKAGLYKLTLKGVEDTAKPTANTILDVTIEIDVPDTSAPYIIQGGAKWGSDDSIIHITFNEEFDYGSAVTRANYKTRLLNKTTGATVENYKALPNTAVLTAQSGNRTVTLDFVDAFARGTYDVEVSVVDVQDLFGNRASDSRIVAVAAQTNSVKSVKATGTQKIEVEFTSALSAYASSNFEFVNGLIGTAGENSPYTNITIDGASANAEFTKVTLTLDKELTPTARYDVNNSLKLKVKNMIDLPKAAGASQDATNGIFEVADGIAPQVLPDTYWYNNGDSVYGGGSQNTIYLVFDEQVTISTTLIPSIKLGSDVFVNKVNPDLSTPSATDPAKVNTDAQVKDGYPIYWTVNPTPTYKNDKYVYELTFGAETRIKGSDITFVYNKTPGQEIKDISPAGNSLGATDFDDVILTGVRIWDTTSWSNGKYE